MAHTFANITPPEGGKITIENGQLQVPDNADSRLTFHGAMEPSTLTNQVVVEALNV